MPFDLNHDNNFAIFEDAKTVTFTFNQLSGMFIVKADDDVIAVVHIDYDNYKGYDVVEVTQSGKQKLGTYVLPKKEGEYVKLHSNIEENGNFVVAFHVEKEEE